MSEVEYSVVDLGAVTAYAQAVENGYTGTLEQWAQLQINSANNYQELFNEIYTKDSSAALWEQGGLSASTGNTASSTTRIRTTDYLPDSVAKIVMNTGYYIMVYVYGNDGTFCGIVKNDYDFSGDTQSLTVGVNLSYAQSCITGSFDLRGLKIFQRNSNEQSPSELYPYKYKIVAAFGVQGTTAITPSGASNITFYENNVGHAVDNELIGIGENEPDSDRAVLWIDKDGATAVHVPEIDDDHVSDVDTWSSEKINSELGQLSEEIEDIEGAAFEKQQMETTSTASGWRLNESDGLSSSDANYKLDKYLVNAGDIIKVISDDRFQFQNMATVPSRGSNNRIGVTYGAGSFLLKVPTGATYLIISTPVESGSSAFLMTPFTDKLADNETNIDFIEGSTVFSAESVYYPHESGDGRFSTNARMFWTELVPKKSLIKRFKTYAATLGSSPILVVETWAVNGDTLTRIKAVSAKNLKANSEIEVEINSYSDKPQMVSYRTYNVNARHYRTNQPGHSWKYTTDIDAETLSLSGLSVYSNMILVGGFDYITESPSDFFSGCYSGNMIVFGDSTVDGSSTTGHTGNVIGTDRTATNEPNVFTSIIEGMINTFTGGSRRVYNAGFGGKTLNYIADNYTDIMAAFSNVKSALLVIDVNSASGTRAEYESLIRTGLERMINLLQADGIAVAIASPQPMFYYAADDDTLPAMNSAGEFAIAVNIGKDICKKYALPFINLGELTNRVMESPYLKSSDFYGDRIHFGDGGHKFEAYELYGELIHPIIYYDGIDKLIGVESNRCELSADSGISASTVGGYRSIVLQATNTRMDVLARFYIISSVPFKIKGVAVSGWASYYDVFVDGTAYTSNTVEAGDEIPAGAYEVTIKPTATEHIVRFSGIIVTK